MKTPAFTMIAMLMVIGCRAHHHRSKKAPQPPTTAPTPVIERTEGSFRPPPAPNLPVKQGPAPLAYIVEAGGPIRIVEAESGATIAEAIAPPRSIVSVDAQAGVRVGSELIVKGPLVAGKTYQIFLEGPDENVFSNQRIRPGKP
jgi:hypothetical protein